MTKYRIKVETFKSTTIYTPERSSDDRFKNWSAWDSYVTEVQAIDIINFWKEAKIKRDQTTTTYIDIK